MKALSRITLLAALLIALETAPASAAPAARHPVCQNLQRDISRLRARLRHGYSARQGERLRSRMRRLKTRYYKRCRPVDRS